MRYQPIYDIAQVCARKGIRQAILCPGSRSAPLVMAFVRHPDIHTRIISDERSAAFIALGIAQHTRTPTVLICTSGSAAYNFAPAVAEAYFQNIPLIIITADRPTEWIDQYDGQTIRQQQIFGQHVKRSFQLPQDYEHPDSTWFVHRAVNEAVNLALDYPMGPVHLNTPFREPLYPAKDVSIIFSEDVKVVEPIDSLPTLSAEHIEQLKSEFSTFDKILIVAGQEDHHERLLKSVERFVRQQQTPIVGDVISNFHGIPSTVRFADSFLSQGGDSLRESLQPELLITFGKSVISKSLKQFLRRHKPLQHWHLQPAGPAADTFQSLTRIIATTPQQFFDTMADTPRKASSFESQLRENYFRLWEAEEHRAERATHDFFSTPAFGEMFFAHQIMVALPARCNLHLANSMAVRYANFIGLTPTQNGIHVFANRGTSGIDGCTSTAVGHALSSEVPNFLLIGDMAFFYDRNAFWHNYPVSNLRIVVLNNHGGTIFNMIDGPSGLPEKDEYFVTSQRLSAVALANEYGFDYLKADSVKKWKNQLKDFLEFDGKTKIIEIETDPTANQQIFERLKKQLLNAYQQ